MLQLQATDGIGSAADGRVLGALVREIADAMQLERPLLLAHSLGCQVCAELSASLPFPLPILTPSCASRPRPSLATQVAQNAAEDAPDGRFLGLALLNPGVRVRAARSPCPTGMSLAPDDHTIASERMCELMKLPASVQRR